MNPGGVVACEGQPITAQSLLVLFKHVLSYNVLHLWENARVSPSFAVFCTFVLLWKGIIKKSSFAYICINLFL